MILAPDFLPDPVKVADGPVELVKRNLNFSAVTLHIDGLVITAHARPLRRYLPSAGDLAAAGGAKQDAPEILVWTAARKAPPRLQQARPPLLSDRTTPQRPTSSPS